MNITDIYMNPVVIGILAGLITFMYMKWKNKNKDKNKNKNKNKKEEKEYEVNLLIPFVMSMVFWFITYAYQCSYDEIENSVVNDTNVNINTVTTLDNVNKLDGGINIKVNNLNNQMMSETQEPESFKMASNGGILVPHKLPPIFHRLN